MSLLIKQLVKDTIFEQQLERGIGIEIPLHEVFGEGTISMSSDIALNNYLNVYKDAS